MCFCVLAYSLQVEVEGSCCRWGSQAEEPELTVAHNPDRGTQLSLTFVISSLCPDVLFVASLVCLSLVFSGLSSSVDRDTDPEQPAGTLLAAELHSAQHLYSWADGRICQLLLKRAESTCSRYDTLLPYSHYSQYNITHIDLQSDLFDSLNELWGGRATLALAKRKIWGNHLYAAFLCFRFQPLSSRVCWSLSCFVESSHRWLSICPRKQSCWCIMGCQPCRRDTTKLFWWRIWVRLQRCGLFL